ncbi:MAG: hypothetical protein K0U34_08835 [Alphaproteobacteria bacterium]|nr:hypothetical protein [Alphaproteobacteria bacterium]
MPFLRRGSGPHHTITDAAETATQTASLGTGTVLTALVSGLALLFSAFSLYQTVLKQAELHLFVPETIGYTRDPNGSFEVLVVPITVANSGARDGIVSSLQLTVRNVETKRERTFAASFFAEPGYFSTKEDYREGKTRPKTPFAPLTVAGRSGYSGTVLFYPREYSEDRVVAAAGKFELKLSARMQTVEQMGVLDRLWATKLSPITFKADLPRVSQFFSGQMLSGKSVRLFIEE